MPWMCYLVQRVTVQYNWSSGNTTCRTQGTGTSWGTLSLGFMTGLVYVTMVEVMLQLGHSTSLSVGAQEVFLGFPSFLCQYINPCPEKHLESLSFISKTFQESGGKHSPSCRCWPPQGTLLWAESHGPWQFIPYIPFNLRWINLIRGNFLLLILYGH